METNTTSSRALVLIAMSIIAATGFVVTAVLVRKPPEPAGGTVKQG